jgi:multisubunit Na+/H+ antiporter MnhF subunit
MIAVAFALTLALASLFLIARLARGPTPADRLIAMHGLLLCAALFAATLHARDPRWIDAALVIVLAGAALLAAGVKALRRQSFQPPLGSPEGSPGGSPGGSP